MEFKINQNVKDIITTTGTLKTITDKVTGYKVIRDTLSNVLTTSFDDLRIANSGYVTVPICFSNKNNIGVNAQELLQKLGMFNDSVVFEWSGCEKITSEIYYEFGFELKPNLNKDVDGIDDTILFLNYYIVVPEGLLDAGLSNTYTASYMMHQIASRLMCILVK